MASKEIKSKLKSAKTAIGQKEYEKGLAICQEVLDVDSECYHALVFAGLCSLEQNRNADAKEYYNMAIHISQSDSLAWKGLADYYDRLGKLPLRTDKEDAIGVYEKCLTFSDIQPTKRQQYQVKLLDLYQSVLLMEKVKSLALEVVYSPEADKLVVQHCWDVLVGMLLNQKGLTEDHMYKIEEGLEALDNFEVVQDDRRTVFFTKMNKLFYSTTCLEDAMGVLKKMREQLEKMKETNVSLHCCMARCYLFKLFTTYPPDLSEAHLEYFQQFSSFSEEDGLDVVFIKKLISVVLLLKIQSAVDEAATVLDSIDTFDVISSLLRGLTYLKRHMYQLSEAELENCLRDMSKFPESWKDQIMSVVNILLCHCYVALGDFRNQRAMSMLDSLQQSISDLPTLHQYIHPLKIELRLSLGDIQMAEQMSVELAKSPHCSPVTTACLQAKVLLKKGDWRAAESSLRELPTEPPNVQVMFLLGQAMWMEDDDVSKAAAYELFLKAAELDPNRSDIFAYIGLYQDKYTRDKHKAIQCFIRALQNGYTNEIAARALCEALEAEKDEEKLLALLKGVTEDCSPTKASWAWKKLGLLQKTRGNYNEALQSLFHVLKCDPRDAVCWECVGEAYLERGSYNPALKSFRKSLELNPESLYCRFRIASILSALLEYSSACQEYKSLLAVENNYVPALKGISETLYKQARNFLEQCFNGRVVECISASLQYLAKALKIEPKYISLWKLLADISFCLADVPLSGPTWKLAIPEELLGSGNTAISKSEILKLGSRACSRIIQLNVKLGPAWHDLGLSYFLRAKECSGQESQADLFDLAVESLKKSVDLSPNDAQFWCTLGTVAAVAGGTKQELAKYALMRSLMINGQNAVAWTNLGLLYLKEDNLKQAHDSFNHAQSADPAYPGAWTAQARVAELVGEGLESMDHYRQACELEYSPVSSKCYSNWVCRTLNETQLSKLSNPDGHGLHPAVLRAVLLARDSMEKYFGTGGDATGLNLLGLLYLQEGLANKAVEAFRRGLQVMDGGSDSRELRRSLLANLASALVAKLEPREALAIYGSGEVLMDPVQKAQQSLACYLLKDCKAADKLLMEASEEVEVERKSDFLVGKAMMSFASDKTVCKEYLFKAFQCQPPSLFALIGLVAFGTLQKDFTLVLAAASEISKLADQSPVILHPECIDVLMYTILMLLWTNEANQSLQEVKVLWLKLSHGDTIGHYLGRSELVSTFELLNHGKLLEAKVSASKFLHMFPYNSLQELLFLILKR